MLKKRAFTLIELLVVVAIIGVLATVVIVNLNNGRVKARDARRQSDLKSVQSALDLYFDSSNHYPFGTFGDHKACIVGKTGNWIFNGGGPVVGVGWVGGDASWSNPYMTSQPHAPTASGCPDPWNINTKAVDADYVYHSTDGSSYTLAAKLENEEKPYKIGTDSPLSWDFWQ